MALIRHPLKFISFPALCYDLINQHLRFPQAFRVADRQGKSINLFFRESPSFSCRVAHPGAIDDCPSPVTRNETAAGLHILQGKPVKLDPVISCSVTTFFDFDSAGKR